MKKKHLIHSLPLLLLLMAAAVGWFATDELGNRARQEIIRESQASLLTLSVYVSQTLNNLEGAVQALAGSPWILPALTSKSPRDIEQANRVLDRYNAALSGSVSYLMDADGTTVASSNRRDPDSFLGKSYRFRPYFQEAAKGQPYRYFALGVTSGKRGFYASFPVRNPSGKVMGVVTMKRDLDGMETFFGKYPYCFLINPDGIVFLSSAPAMVLKSLWPVDKAVQEKMIASQQFGNKPFEAVLKREISDGMEVALGGDSYLVSRKGIDGNGWSILLLSPLEHIRNYQLIGVLATVSVCLLILIFSVIIYLTYRSREAIRKSEESKRLLLHAAGEGIFGVDAMGQVTFVNPAALKMFEFSEEEMLGRSVHGLIHHTQKDGSSYPIEDCPMYASCTRAEQRNVVDEVLWRKDGSHFSVEYSSKPIAVDGKIMGAVVTFKDVAHRKLAEEALKESESRMRTITDSAQDAILMMDSEGLISYWNPAAERILGYTGTEAIGQVLHALIAPPRYHEAQRSAFPLFQQKGQGAALGKTLDLEALRKDGTEISVQLSLSAIHMKGAWHAVGVIRDITEQRQSEEKIRQMAYHDPLTGLPNRMLLIDRLTMAMSQADRKRNRVALMMLDLDKFKEVNDTHGHHIGDLLLKSVADKLRSILRQVDTVARFGGDEFVLVLPEQNNGQAALQIAEKIMEAFRDTVILDGHPLTITSSIGISLYPDHGADIDTILKNADSAMYQAKEAGRNRYRLFDGA